MARKSENEDSEDLLTLPKRPLSVAEKRQERVNQFVRNNPKLRAELDKRQADDARHGLADLQEVSQYLLDKVIALATADPEHLDEHKAADALRLVRSEEMHQAKVGKIKADTEAVLINVATPTAIRQIVNEIGMAIKTGTEEAVFEEMEHASDEAREIISRVGASIYGRIMLKIQKMGYEDNSLSRALAAPR